jgi:hypothetical protein
MEFIPKTKIALFYNKALFYWNTKKLHHILMK